MRKMNTHEEVEKTITSLDTIERAEVSESFESQLFQKVAFLPQKESFKWLRYSAAAMILMALVNLFILVQTTPSEQEQQSEIAENILYQAIDYTEFE